MLDSLEARGFVEILQNGAVVLTDAGKLLRRALSGISDGKSIPINPVSIRVLKALRDVSALQGEKMALPKDTSKVIELSGLDEETFGEELLNLRASNLIGKTSFHDSGIQLLEVYELINRSS